LLALAAELAAAVEGACALAGERDPESLLADGSGRSAAALGALALCAQLRYWPVLPPPCVRAAGDCGGGARRDERGRWRDARLRALQVGRPHRPIRGLRVGRLRVCSSACAAARVQRRARPKLQRRLLHRTAVVVRLVRRNTFPGNREKTSFAGPGEGAENGVRDAACLLSTGEGTRRVCLVRGEGRGVSL